MIYSIAPSSRRVTYGHSMRPMQTSQVAFLHPDMQISGHGYMRDMLTGTSHYLLLVALQTSALYGNTDPKSTVYTTHTLTNVKHGPNSSDDHTNALYKKASRLHSNARSQLLLLQLSH